MRHRLLLKLILCYIIGALSMFTLLNTYGVSRLEHSLVEGKKTILYNEANLISTEYMTSFYKEEMPLYTLSTQLKTIDTFLDVRIWIVNKQGIIIADTRASSAKSNSINIYTIDPTFLETTAAVRRTYEGLFTEPMLSIVKPISLNYQVKGYIVINASLKTITEESIHYMDIINLCFLMFMIVMFLLFCYIYYMTIMPLKKVIIAAQQYTHANYDFPLVIKSNDEYEELSNSLSYIAGELSNLEDYQKKFVANISHDFRSPLTSIKGFTEAILDGTIPPEMQEKYLGIILFETERLSKLTTSLLALNSFEKNGTILDITSFDINHIIKKTAESFEQICREKKVTFTLILFDQETYVDADMGKIQQVLYNLIDNAIKFSHSNSSITISIVEKSARVFISIKDNGIGIPKDSLKKIWERFYKTDSSRGKDKKGTGLGLSITKEIIQAHHENINVISTEGVGTEFVFSLPRSLE